MKRNLIKISAIGTALFGFAFVASAATWTPPTATPPANNVSAPINISTSTQTKEGGLVVGNTSGGFVNYGASALVGRVDIGPFDCYYVYGATSYLCSTGGGTGGTGGGGGVGSASLMKDFAINNPTSFIGNLISSFTPSIAHAVGTPSTDKLHVNGDVSVNGAMRVGGYTSSYDVCIKNGTNCPSASSLFPIGTNPSVTTTQGAYIGWNAITGGTGETDFINSKGGGSGGFAFQNVASSSGATRTTLMRITGGGAVGIGTGTADPAADLEVSGASNRNNPIVKITSSGTANGDNAAGTERGLTVEASSAAGQGQLLNVKRGTTSLFSVNGNGNVGVGTSGPSTKLDVAGQIRIQGGSPGVGRVLTSDATGLATWGASTIAVYAMNPHCISDSSSRQNGVLTFLPWCNEPGGGGRTWWNVKNAPYSTSGPGPYSYTLGTDGSNNGTAPPVGYGDVFFRGFQGPGGGRTLISGNCYGITSTYWYQHCNAYYPPMGVIMPAEPVSSWPTAMTAPFSSGVGSGSGPYYVLP